MAKRPMGATRVRSVLFTKDGIEIDLDATPYDRLAWHFAAQLNALRLPYAMVAGYPSILLGRSRTSEDIDVLASPLPLSKFVRLHRRLIRRLECLAPGSAESLFAEYLDAGAESTSVRYSWPSDAVPNVEFKFTSNAVHAHSVSQRIRVRANGHLIQIGPLGVQIGYKLSLGGQKDLEDARWIYKLAKGHFDEQEIWETARKLRIDLRKARRDLGVD